MTLREDYQSFQKSLETIYDKRESENITGWVFESLTDLSRTKMREVENWISDKNFEDNLQHCLDELLTHKPVQYVLGEVFFYRMKLKVNEHVLIPRPETEELVEWIVSENKNNTHHKQSIIDIGTGSGCIAIALKKEMQSAKVTAIDIDKDALEVARCNSKNQSTEVEFIKIDFLDKAQLEGLGKFDIIVSNPPYIPVSEKSGLDKNVSDYEPSQALFVPDEDPLIFYKTILDFTKEHSEPGAIIYVEAHEKYADAVEKLFISYGLKDVVMKKDIYGRNRMVRGTTA